MKGGTAHHRLDVLAWATLTVVTFVACGGDDPFGMKKRIRQTVATPDSLALPTISGTIAFTDDLDPRQEQMIPTPYIYVTFYPAVVSAGVSPNITALTSGNAPVWSPDGRKLAFVRPPGGARYPEGIYVAVADADGSKATWLAEGNNPSWAPDGTRIVFDLTGEIRVIDIDGTNLTTLLSYDGAWGADTHDPPGVSDPAWSPDGEQIVFTRSGEFTLDASTFRADMLYVMDVDGSHLRPFIAEPGCGHSSATWSPEGSEIAFTSCKGVTVAAADGSAERVLTEGRDPAWSPDGHRLAFANGRSWYVIDEDGGLPDLLIPNRVATASGSVGLTWRASPDE